MSEDNRLTWGWFEPEDIGRAVKALREGADVTLDDIYEGTNGSGLIPPAVELIEEWGGLHDIDEISVYADACDCSPGEFLDAVLVVAEAHSHNIEDEKRMDDRADRLLALFEKFDGCEIPLDVLKAHDLENAEYDGTLNVLHDRDIKVETLRKSIPDERKVIHALIIENPRRSNA